MNGELYIEHDTEENILIAGTVCNTGLIPYYKFNYDDVFSLDENLTEMISDIYEVETDGSWSDNLTWIRDS